MVHSFADHFWDQEFNGTNGYDTLISRLKDGKKFCDTFTDFLRNRSKIEEEYGKSLQRLAQISVNNDEIGSLKYAWEAVRREADGIGQVHIELAKKFNDLIERTLKLREKQKFDRYAIDDKMKKLQKDKKMSYETMVKAKKSYDQRCKEADQYKEAYDSKTVISPKEEDRLKKNLLKAKSSTETADSLYQSSVKQLEDCQRKWILEMEDACRHFQSFEEERIQFLRNEMWIYTNLGTLQVIETNAKYESCRKFIEKCDEKADIQLFINTKHTGSERPASIPYENYYHSTQQTQPPTVAQYTASNPNNRVTSLGRNVNSNSLGRNSNNGSLGRNAMLPKQGGKANALNSPTSSDWNKMEDAYSVISDLRENMPSRVTRVKAAFNYQAQGPQELTLRCGDIIEVVSIEDESWAHGTIDGRAGAFPREFVEEY